MNQQLQDFARQELLAGLKQLPESWQHRFKQMYAHDNLMLSIEEVVTGMDEDKLDWAMEQVRKSLAKCM